jgi:hypothetical protein
MEGTEEFHAMPLSETAKTAKIPHHQFCGLFVFLLLLCRLPEGRPERQFRCNYIIVAPEED